jgi:hypothetical protein
VSISQPISTIFHIGTRIVSSSYHHLIAQVVLVSPNGNDKLTEEQRERIARNKRQAEERLNEPCSICLVTPLAQSRAEGENGRLSPCLLSSSRL